MLEFLAHLFVPRYSNNHRAKLLHTDSLTFLIFFILIFQFAIGHIPSVVIHGEILGYAANIAPSEVIRLTNEKRAQNGLPPLIDNPSLDRAAQAKGADMLSKGYWAHVAPDGIQPWAFFMNVGYNYRYAGENLARDFANPSSAIDAWMASPSHRENLLSPKYKEIGIGVVEGKLAGVDTTIVVQFFGTKMVDNIPIAPIANVKAQEIAAKPIVQSIAVQEPVVNVSKVISFVIASILILVVVVDGFVVHTRKIVRVGGRSFAHFAFLGMILAIIIIIRVGQIL